MSRPLLPPLNAHDRRRRAPLEKALDARWPWSQPHIMTSITWIMMMASVSLFAALAIPTLIIFNRLPMWSVVLAVAPAALAIPISLVLLERRLQADRYRDAYLRIGLCPSCGYDIGAAAGEPDGCRVCPECGGAWRENDE